LNTKIDCTIFAVQRTNYLNFMYMKKHLFRPGGIATMAAIGLLALASCSRNDIIESPESIACVNMSRGDLKATRVVTTDTATTVWFRMEYPVGASFRYGSDSYLRDETGQCYPLRSAEGIKLDEFIQRPDTNVFEFKMNFEPLSRKVQMFDFIEGYVDRAFMLLGIHDQKLEKNAPSLEHMIAANPYTVPDDWIKTDTITIRGRIEGYDAEKFGFTSMEFYFNDVFEKNSTTLVLDIAPDGTFERRFRANYPVRNYFHTYDSKLPELEEIHFFARPGETIDITVRPNEQGRYECFYNSGSSKECERWLKTIGVNYQLLGQLSQFKGTFAEAKVVAEKLWRDLTLRTAIIGRRNNFTPQEMQLALAEMQIGFAYALLNYAMDRDHSLMKFARVENEYGVNYEPSLIDTAEYKELYKIENYLQLQRIDFDNPLLMASNDFSITINRLQYSKILRTGGFITEKNMEQWIENLYNAFREVSASDHDDLIAQICGYKEMQNHVRNCIDNESEFIPSILANKNMPDTTKQRIVSECPSIDSLMPHHLAHFTNQGIRQLAEQYIARETAKTEPTTPLPENNWAADFIRSFNARYPGRILMFDFWGMGCGPCRQAIQDSKPKRAETAKLNDVKLIFVAEEFSSEGSEPYKKYVSEWLADEETVCLPVADYARLRELFEFNGIPHYETITPDGRRVREDLKFNGPASVNKTSLKRLKEKLKN